MSDAFLGKLLIVISGLLCFVFKPVIAVPILQDNLASPVSDFSLSGSSDEINYLAAGNRLDWNKLNYKTADNELILSEIIDSEVLFSKLQSLYNSDYFDQRINAPEDQFSSQENTRLEKLLIKKNRSINTTNTNAGLMSLFDPLKDNVQIREGISDLKDSIKDVQYLMTVNAEISYASSEQESRLLVQRELEQQKKQRKMDEKGISDTSSNEGYNPSLLKDFISNIFYFMFYLFIGVVLIKFLLFLLKWTRRISRHRRKTSRSRSSSSRRRSSTRKRKYKRTGIKTDMLKNDESKSHKRKKYKVKKFKKKKLKSYMLKTNLKYSFYI